MPLSDNPIILVFDSGVGGLSIAAEIQRQIPKAIINYCSDNAAFPYGTKGEAELISRVDTVLRTLCAIEPIDIIVIACNSASTLALPHIRNHFKQPIVGVVPAIKPAAEISQTKKIGLLATPGTVSRTYTQQLIADFARDCEVTLHGSTELVVMAEEKLRGETISTAKLGSILTAFSDRNIDTLVLACTHFPLLKQEIQDWLGNDVTLVDSAEAIARRIIFLLSTMNIGHLEKGDNKSFFTLKNTETEQLKPALARYNLADIRYLDC